jgi:hypothetical protein
MGWHRGGMSDGNQQYFAIPQPPAPNPRPTLVAFVHKNLNLLCRCPENVEHGPAGGNRQGSQHDRNPKIDIHKTVTLLKQIPIHYFYPIWDRFRRGKPKSLGQNLTKP